MDVLAHEAAGEAGRLVIDLEELADLLAVSVPPARKLAGRAGFPVLVEGRFAGGHGPRRSGCTTTSRATERRTPFAGLGARGRIQNKCLITAADRWPKV